MMSTALNVLACARACVPACAYVRVGEACLRTSAVWNSVAGNECSLGSDGWLRTSAEGQEPIVARFVNTFHPVYVFGKKMCSLRIRILTYRNSVYLLYINSRCLVLGLGSGLGLGLVSSTNLMLTWRKKSSHENIFSSREHQIFGWVPLLCQQNTWALQMCAFLMNRCEYFFLHVSIQFVLDTPFVWAKHVSVSSYEQMWVLFLHVSIQFVLDTPFVWEEHVNNCYTDALWALVSSREASQRNTCLHIASQMLPPITRTPGMAQRSGAANITKKRFVVEKFLRLHVSYERKVCAWTAVGYGCVVSYPDSGVGHELA